MVKEVHKYLVYNYSANGETDEPLFKTIRELHKFDINKCNRRYCNGDFVNEKQHNIQMSGSLIKRSPTRLKHKTKSFIVRSFIFLNFQRQ